MTRGIVRRRARPEYLQNQANKVNYCNYVILERDARTKQWSVRIPGSSMNPYGGVQSIQSSVPFFSVSSQYLATAPARSSTVGDTSYRRRYRYR